MRLSTILKKAITTNILNHGQIKRGAISGGNSGNLQVIECLTRSADKAPLFNNAAIRQLSSASGTTKTSDTTKNGDNTPTDLSEQHLTKKGLSSSSYKPVQLAYMSYEKKSKDKVRN